MPTFAVGDDVYLERSRSLTKTIVESSGYRVGAKDQHGEVVLFDQKGYSIPGRSGKDGAFRAVRPTELLDAQYKAQQNVKVEPSTVDILVMAATTQYERVRASGLGTGTTADMLYQALRVVKAELDGLRSGRPSK